MIKKLLLISLLLYCSTVFSSAGTRSQAMRGVHSVKRIFRGNRGVPTGPSKINRNQFKRVEPRKPSVFNDKNPNNKTSFTHYKTGKDYYSK